MSRSRNLPGETLLRERGALEGRQHNKVLLFESYTLIPLFTSTLTKHCGAAYPLSLGSGSGFFL